MQFRFNDELIAIEDTDQHAKDDPLKQVVTKKGTYLCRKVLIACGLLHFARRLPVLDALESKSVYYKVPKIGDYDGGRVVVVGGGDSAFDAAVMALEPQRRGRRCSARTDSHRQSGYGRPRDHSRAATCIVVGN